MSYDCKICGKQFENPVEFRHHLKKIHQLSNQEYYDKYLKIDNEGICKQCGKPTKFYGFNKGYNEFCGNTCSNLYRVEHSERAIVNCLECGTEIISETGLPDAMHLLTSHIKSVHGLTAEIYYNKHLNHDNSGKCLNCGEKTNFISLSSGYYKYCSTNCAQAHFKTQNNSYTNKLISLSNIRDTLKKMAANIKSKYTNFIKTDKASITNDIRPNDLKVEQKLIQLNEKQNSLDGVVEVKTEIATSTRRNPWIGNQYYIPKYESADMKINYSDIDDEQSFSSNEWC